MNHISKTKPDIKYRAYKFSLNIIKYVSEFPKNSICKTISNQLLRSATSIGANIVEAKSASSKRDFIKYYEISLKSSNETKYWLCLARDSNMNINNNISIKLLKESIEISNILASCVLTLKGKRR